MTVNVASATLAADQITIKGQATDSANASAFGIALSGLLSVGASEATATVRPNVAVAVSGSAFDAGSLTIEADVLKPAGHAAQAEATGASGAFVGINATVASAVNQATASAQLSGGSLTASGLVSVLSNITTDQDSDASGIAAGIVAVGANKSSATSASNGTAKITGVGSFSAGSLTVQAVGTDTNDATATSGSGGVIAGAAASATTDSEGTIAASIDGSGSALNVTSGTGTVRIAATHTANFSGWVNSLQAAAIGVSGSTLTNTVNSTVDAHLGSGVSLNAKNLTIDARNLVANTFLDAGSNGGWNINAGSGGIVNAPAGSTTTTVAQTTTAAIGSNTGVHLLAPTTGLSTLFLEAYNSTVVQQQAKIDAAAAIAVASAETAINVGHNTASVSFGNGSSTVVDVGTIEANAWDSADLEGHATATSDGLAGAPTGKAHAVLDAANTVTVGTDALVEVSDGIDPTDGTTLPTGGTIILAAGQGHLGGGVLSAGAIKVDTTVDLFNNTAIPIPTAPDAYSAVSNASTVLIGVDTLAYQPKYQNGPAITGATYDPDVFVHRGVNAAGDISLIAEKGALDVNAVGTGKNIYLEALSEVASAVSNAFGGGDVSFDIKGGSTSKSGSVGTLTLNGFVQTGLQKDKSLTISYAPGATTGGNVTLDGNIGATVSGPVSVGADILSRIQQLQLLVKQYAADAIAVGAYQSELKFLYAEAAGMGLGTVSTDGKTFTLNPQVTAPASNAQARDTLNTAQQTASTGQANFGTALKIAPAGAGSAAGVNIASDVQDSTYGLIVTSNGALAGLKTLTNYSSAYNDKNSSSVRDAVADVATQQGLITGYGTTISTSSTAITNAQADIAAQSKIIVDKQNQLTTVQIAGGDTSALLLAIGTAKAQIATDLTTVKSNTTALNTAVTNLTAANTKISTDFTTIKNASYDGSKDASSYATLTAYTAPSGSTAAKFGALGGFNNAVADIVAQAKVVSDSATATLSQIGTLADTTKTGAGTATLNSDFSGNNSLNQWVGLLSTQSTTVVQDTAAVNAPATDGSLQTYRVTVADTATRLGNIALVADAVSGAGTGELHAPGDASITIINKTADELDLGNLANPGYDAGHIRLNGVLTNTTSDINHLDGGSLTLHAMETSTGAVPTITIKSLYDPGDKAYADSTPTGAARVAPDIVLQAATTDSNGVVTSPAKSIYNPNGSLTVLSEAGNIFLRGPVNVGATDIEAKNGDFSTSYTNTFQFAGGDPAAGLPTGAGITANGAVFISARYLDINSTIQSGIVQWQLGLTTSTPLTAIDSTSIGVSKADLAAAAALANSASNKIANLSAVNASYGSGIWVDASGKTPELRFTQAYAETYAASHSTVGYEVVNANNTIGATYDAQAKVFSVDNTAVHGGSVTLYGQILNTSFSDTQYGGTTASAGQINVLDGFGTIEINNTTGHAVILGNLDAGADASGIGRGTAGIIDITDVHQITGGVDFKQTIYTRTYVPGASGDGTVTAAITEWQVLNGSTTAVNTTNSSVSTAGRNTSYDPLAGERYVWTNGTNYAATTNFSVTADVVFGNDDWSFNDVTKLQNATTSVTSSHRLDDGTYVSAQTQKDNTSVNQGTNGIIITTSAGTPLVNTDSTVERTRLITSVDDYNTAPNNQPVKTGEESHCVWWTACIDSKKTAYYRLDQTYTEITTNSLKADNPIGIHFIGSNTGLITVGSNSDIVLDGAVNNRAGTTTITATGTTTTAGTTTSNSIVQGTAGALITSKSIDLEAAGSVGGVANTYASSSPANSAVAVALSQTLASDKGLNAPTGTLTAIAGNGNVAITSPGTLNIATVTAAGSVAAGTGTVALSAGGSILAQSGTSVVQGDMVTLTAANGTIGGATALTVNTGYTDDQSKRPFGDPATTAGLNVYYGLTAYAGGSINIASSKWADNADGSILVNQVVSSGGDVTLNSTGHILDNNPDQTVDQKSYAALLGYWNSLGLLPGAANTAKTAQAITAYEQAKTNDYNQYWQIRRTQANGGTVFDPTFQVTIAKGSAQYNALHDYYAGQSSSETIDQRIADYAASETATYRALNAKVGSLPAPQIDPVTKQLVPYKYVASDAERTQLTAGSTWSEKELALQLSAGALKTVTSTNTVLKAPNVSGQNVTLNAKVGIGETAGTPANPGLQISWGTQVGSLTSDQKVALAAAERPDLTLTVSGFQTLSTSDYAALNATQQQTYDAALAAWNAAGITGSVTIQLGSVDNTAQAVTPELVRERAALKAAAAGYVIGQGSYLSILPKRPLNVAATGTLDVTVLGTGAVNDTVGQTHPKQDDGTAYIASPGSLALGTISVKGDTRIKVADSISNAAISSINTGNIILEAAQGQIGNIAQGTPLQLGKVGTIVARGLNGVDLKVNGNASIDTIYSPGNIQVEATKSITNANTDLLINVLGTNVALISDAGSIGTVGGALNVGTNLGGGITATALHGSVNLYGPSGEAFLIDAVTAGTTVGLTAAGDGTIDGLVQAGGDVQLEAGGKLGLTKKGRVTTAAGNVMASAGSVKMIDGATIAPTLGKVSITTTGNALVTGITSNSTAFDAISVISTGGFVLAGIDPHRAADLTDLAGGGVVVQAALGIGNKTEADFELADLPGDTPGTADLVTDAANPLRINSRSLSLLAQTGDVDAITGVAVDHATVLARTGSIDLKALAPLHAESLSTPLGSIVVTGQGTLSLDTLTAGTGLAPTSGTIAVTASAGTLTIGTATSGGSQTLVAQKALDFTTLTTTGLPNDIGDISVTSKTATVTGGTLNAHGSATVTGADLDLDTVTTGAAADLEAVNGNTGTLLQTGTSATLVAGKRLDWAALTIGTTLDASATAGTLAIGTATSGGSQMLFAQNALDFTTLTTTGLAGDIGNIAVTSKTATVTGGTLTAHGSATVTGADLDLDTVTTGAAADLEAVNGNTGTLLQTGTSARLVAGKRLDWTKLVVGTALDASATAGTLAIGTATSGGSQTLVAQNALDFTTLTTTGLAGDLGNIAVTSKTATVTGGTLNAHGSATVTGADLDLDTVTTGAAADLEAVNGNRGKLLQTGTSTKLVAGTAVDWTKLTIGTTLDASATAGTLTIGTARSGGSQTLFAQNALGFTTLTTTGLPNDIGNIGVTSKTATVTGHALNAHGSATVTGADLDLDTVTTGAAADLEAVNGNIGTLLQTGTSARLAAGNRLDWTKLVVGTTLDASATAGTLSIGAATSGGSQTLFAQNGLDFTTLTTTGLLNDVGNIAVTSKTATVTGNTLTAHGSATVIGADLDLDTVTAGAAADLEAANGNTGTMLQTGTSAKLVAGNTIDWATLRVGTTLDATAVNGPLHVDTATSGGTETLTSGGLLSFAQLTSLGGDIVGASTGGSIAGGSIASYGSTRLKAAGDNTGHTIVATTGAIDLEAGGLIRWDFLGAGRSIDATSTGGPISVVTATGGGSQHYDAAGTITFGTLKTSGIPGDPGNVGLVSHTGAVNGTDVMANGRLDVFGNGVTFREVDATAGIGIRSTAGIAGDNFRTLGDVSMDAAGTIELGTLTGANLMLTSPGRIHFSNLSVHTSVTFAAGDVDVGLLQQTPTYTGPLTVSITGYKGGVGNTARLSIDAPNGLVMPELYETTAVISTTARRLTIADAYITGTLDLRTPFEHTWVNNITSQPVLGNNLQLYALGKRFAFREDGNLINTTSYVVQYDTTPAVQDVLYGQLYWGASMVRDFDRIQHNGNDTLFLTSDPDGSRSWQFPVDAFDQHLERMGRVPVSGSGSTPAVNTTGSGSAPRRIKGFKIVVGQAP